MNDRGPTIPATQQALQLVGPDELRLNRAKEVFRPGPTQVLAKIEAVGLCFSDLKLLKQFAAHTRKSGVVSGLSPDVLAEIPSYVPGVRPTVPGHEAVCRIVAVGADAAHHRVGERCLIQTDYRQLRTAGSNAAFGYNFEGALQEYVLMDERVIVDPADGRRFLIPVSEELSASAVCLVEPWACVEGSYVNEERRTIRAAGRLLVVADAGREVAGLAESFSPQGRPASIAAVCKETGQLDALRKLGTQVDRLPDASAADDEAFDDIVYFGAAVETIETLNDKLAAGGIINIVTGGRKIGQLVSVGVGRVHYGMTRWIGTTGAAAAEAYGMIPPAGEIRPGEKIVVIGAGGPMGQMHVIRSICSGVEGVSVVATDLDDGRLESLRAKAGPLAEANGVELRLVNPASETLDEKFTYSALMVPVPALLAQAIRDSADGGLINVFAGIPAPTRHKLDLDTCIKRRCFLFGTSGSLIRDMEIVLEKVTSGRLDTNCSVEAVAGMAGAADGIRAIERRELAGKIIVYPALHELPLTPLSDLAGCYPTVAAALDNGAWCKAAEQELLRVAG